MTCNAVTVITDQNALRSALGLSGQTNLIPEAVVMVGHPFGGGEDTTPPATTCTLQGTQQGSAFVSPVQVTLTATDNNSGVDYTKYKVDTGNWTTYAAPFNVSNDGTHTVYFYSVDNVGNKETEKSTSFTIRYYNITVINGGWASARSSRTSGRPTKSRCHGALAFPGGLPSLKRQAVLLISNQVRKRP